MVADLAAQFKQCIFSIGQVKFKQVVKVAYQL
jgi:hypothetical protein